MTAALSQNTLLSVYTRVKVYRTLRPLLEKTGSEGDLQSLTVAIGCGCNAWNMSSAVSYQIAILLGEKSLSISDADSQLPSRSPLTPSFSKDCGWLTLSVSDPLPFQFLSQGFRDNIIYVDIDYPALISIKAQKVATDPLLTPLLHNIHLETAPTDNAHIRLRSDEYFAIGCDLEQLDWLNALFEKEGFLSSEILFTAEVSVTYMRTEPANALINWAAGLPKGLYNLSSCLIAFS